MKEKINTSKQGTPLAHDKLAKTCTPEKEAALKIKFKLKFTDYAVDNFMSTFGIPPRERIFTPLDVSRQSALKGLRLCQYFEGKKKYVNILANKTH